MGNRSGATPSSRMLFAGCRAGLAAVAGFSLLLNLLMLIVPLYSMQVFDRVLHTGSSATLAYLTLIALGGLGLASWLDFTRARILQEIGLWLERRLAPDVLLASFSQPGGAPAIPGAQLLRDTAAIRQFICGPAVVALCDMPWAPVYVVALYLLHPLLGATALMLGAALVALAALSHAATCRPLRAAGELAITGLKDAAISDAQRETVMAMGLARRLVERWLAANEAVLRLQSLAGARANALLALSRFTRLAGQVMVLGVAAYLVVRHDATGGAMMASSIILQRALAPVEQAIASWRGVVAVRGAWQRIGQQLARLAAAPRPQAMLPRLEGRLSAERVTVAAGPRTGPVLRGVSFTVAPGRVLAVLGPSGAGKTTLARTIVGALAPLDGRLCLDGVRICAWDRNELGRHIGYLPQDASLLEGTVRETIARGDPQASLADVVAAARWAGAHELVLGLPQGYETRLGELGTVLPPGHRRRIALARALFGEPRLLVLDEPDANLDGDGEVALVRALAEAKARGITVVVVTNRPSLLRAVDDVLVLRDGVAERFGPRDAVISQLIQPHPVAAQAASR